MVEAAIFLIAISIFLEFAGRMYVVYTLWNNQRKNIKYFKDMNDRFKQLNAETQKVYEDFMKTYQQQTSAVSVTSNFLSHPGDKN